MIIPKDEAITGLVLVDRPLRCPFGLFTIDVVCAAAIGIVSSLNLKCLAAQWRNSILMHSSSGSNRCVLLEECLAVFQFKLSQFLMKIY